MIYDSSESDEEAASFKFDLPSELLLHTFHCLLESLCETSLPSDACRALVPLSLVSRRFAELARPLTLKHVRISASRSYRLLAILCGPRRWGSHIASLQISFGDHFKPGYTTSILNIISNCSSLQSLSLLDVGKPVFKTFSTEASSIHFSPVLSAILANLLTLEVCGSRKAQSTGLDAARLIGFLLPLCKSLRSFKRGHFTFRAQRVAALQPIPSISLCPDESFQIPTLRSLTLSTTHLGSRIFHQAIHLCPTNQLEELIIHCNDIPNRHILLSALQTLSPSLRILKLLVPFPQHRVQSTIDQIGSEVLPFPKLETLILSGPIYSVALLDNLIGLGLTELGLSHNRSVTVEKMMHYLATGEGKRRLMLDDQRGKSWTEEGWREVRRCAEKNGWEMLAANENWRHVTARGGVVQAGDKDWSGERAETEGGGEEVEEDLEDQEVQEDSLVNASRVIEKNGGTPRSEENAGEGDEDEDSETDDDSDVYSEDWSVEPSFSPKLPSQKSLHFFAF